MTVNTISKYIYFKNRYILLNLFAVVSCNKLILLENTEIKTTPHNITYGSIINIDCILGHETILPVEKTFMCTEMKTWNSTLFSCNRKFLQMLY